MSITIGNLDVIESWEEYGIEIDDDVIVPCASRWEAEDTALAAGGQVRIMRTRYYRTEWEEIIT